MDRDRILAVIDSAYEARQQGDKAKMAQYWAPAAEFRIVGSGSLDAALIGPGAAERTVEQLIDTFRFHKVERIDALVDGNRAAVRSRLTVSAGEGEPLDTELFDLIEVDGEGRIRSMVQFTDTMTIAHLLGWTATA